MQINNLHHFQIYREFWTAASLRNENQSDPQAGTSAWNAAVDPQRDRYPEMHAIQSYFDDLRKLPEIRPELVESGRANLQSGNFMSSVSAAQTAEALIANQRRVGG